MQPQVAQRSRGHRHQDRHHVVEHRRQIEPGPRPRQHQAAPEQQDRRDRPRPPDEPVGPVVDRDPPRRVEQLLQRLEQAQPRPQRQEHRADHHRDAAADVGLQDLGADDRDVAEGRVDQLLAQLLVVLHQQSDDVDEGEQQREGGEEAPVGEDHGELTPPVLAVLLEHGVDHRQGRDRALPAVEAVRDPVDQVAGRCCAGVCCFALCCVAALAVARHRRTVLRHPWVSRGSPARPVPARMAPVPS